MKGKKIPGRNVANIVQLKVMLSDYSKQKKLPDDIAQWHNKVFLRWLINHFKDVQAVRNKEQFFSLTREQAPAWFIDKLKNVDFIYINPKDPKLLETLEKATEWLGSKYPQLADKFPRITVPHVLEKWQKDHDYMQRKRSNTIETSGEGLITCFSHEAENNEHYHIIEMLPNHAELPFEMARESSYMQHCLGEFDDVAEATGGYGEHYYRSIKEQTLRLFSLRDSKNKPHATIALSIRGDKKLWVDQIKGKQNTAPVARYVSTVQAFLNHLNVHYDYHGDCLKMGLIFDKGRSLNISEIEDENTQQFLLSHDPTLITKMTNPPISSKWLALLCRPELVTKVAGTTESMKIASLLQKPLLMTEISLESGVKSKDILQGLSCFKLGSRLIRFIKLQPKKI